MSEINPNELYKLVSNSNQPISQQTKRTNLWLPIIAILLAIILTFNVLQYLNQSKQDRISSSRAEAYSERVDSALIHYESNQKVLDGLMDGYEKAVYDNENVDNIYNQQLQALEYNFITLQYLARQNQEIILLLSSLP
jgi:metal-responsive CopG/Arc/MetJ family transcriptional regulator